MGKKVVLVQFVVVGPFLWLLWACRPIWGNGHCGIKEETSALMQAWGHSHPLSHLSSVCGPFSLCRSPGHRITGRAIISTIQSAPFMWEIRPRELPPPALCHKVPLLSDNTASLISLHVWLRPWCPVWILKTKQNAHIITGESVDSSGHTEDMKRHKLVLHTWLFQGNRELNLQANQKLFRHQIINYDASLLVGADHYNSFM